MSPSQITFPNHQTITLPSTTVVAIAQSSANYSAPLWSQRAERVLKLGAHQWIDPLDPAAAQLRLTAQPSGILCTGWKLFTRSWQAAAEAYFRERETYPDHPRHLGEGVIPLVDEDVTIPNVQGMAGEQSVAQIGWVRIEQTTSMDQHFAIFVQFTLLDLFVARPLPNEYA